jgi:hypothetical protein
MTMRPLADFDFHQDAIVWRRKTTGCMVALGVVTTVLGGLFTVGGIGNLIREGHAVGAVHGILGVGMLAFGLFLAAARSEVRVTRERADRRITILVPVKREAVLVRDCRALVVRRGAVAIPGAPRTPSPLVPTISVGLVRSDASASGADPFFPLATEQETDATEASVGRTLDALVRLTGLRVEDQRRPFEEVVAELRRRR